MNPPQSLMAQLNGTPLVYPPGYVPPKDLAPGPPKSLMAQLNGTPLVYPPGYVPPKVLAPGPPTNQNGGAFRENIHYTSHPLYSVSFI